MVELAVPPVRARVLSTAGPLHVVGRFDPTSPTLPTDRVRGADETGSVASWLQQLDGDLAHLVGEPERARLRPLSVVGRPVLPAPATATSARSSEPIGMSMISYAGQAVTDGSFVLNGVTVPVFGRDGLAEVMARINRSGTGVTARYDSTADHLVLTSSTPGGGGRISLADDTSGFVAAFKLAEPDIRPGRDAGYDRPVSTLNGLATVRSGTLRINEVELPIDAERDSLEVIAGRITQHTDGTATFDPISRRLTLSADLPPGSLRIVDDTGFLDAAGIRPGVYVPAATHGSPVDDAVMVITSTAVSLDRIVTRVVENGDGYGPAASTGPSNGPAGRPAGGGASSGRSTNTLIADRAALAGERPAPGRATSTLEAIAIRRQHLPEASLDEAARFFRGGVTSTSDGFFDRMRRLPLPGQDGPPRVSDRLWVT